MSLQGTFGSGGEVVFNLRVDTSQASLDINSLMENFTKLEQVALRYLAIARRMGLPDNVQEQVDSLVKMIVVINQARLTFKMLELELGPIGWAMFAASGILTAFSAGDALGSFL